MSKPKPSVSNSPQRRWANPNEAAEYLGVSTRTVRQMIADGRLRGYRNGPQNDPPRSQRDRRFHDPFGGCSMSGPDYAQFAELEDLGVIDHQADEIGGDIE